MRAHTRESVIHAAPSQDTWVNRAARAAPSSSKNRPRVSLLRPSPAHPAGRWRGRPRRSDSGALAVGDLIDADPGQPIEQIVGVAAIGDHSGH